MTYQDIVEANRVNGLTIKNKARITELSNCKRTCMIEYDNGQTACMDIPHIISTIFSQGIAIKNISKIRPQIERMFRPLGIKH